jgi:hypothetical protein
MKTRKNESKTLLAIAASQKGARKLGACKIESHSRLATALHLNGSFASATWAVFGKFDSEFANALDADSLALGTVKGAGQEAVAVCVKRDANKNTLHVWHGRIVNGVFVCDYAVKLNGSEDIETATMANSVEVMRKASRGTLQVITNGATLAKHFAEFKGFAVQIRTL